MRLIILLTFLCACYGVPEVPGFDPGEWNAEISCTQDRLDQAHLLVNHSQLLLSCNQNEITNLLGEPDEHELYNRNEKFFFYDLSLPCDSIPQKRLSLRFDALGRMKEIMIAVE